MNQILRACACLGLACWLAGCSTVQGDFHQKLQVDALDAQNRPVDGMQCQLGTGSSAIHFVTPATDVRVRRAMQPLAIQCQRDSLVATATVKSRRARMEEALLPFGSAGVFIDHVSGALYEYPTALHLRVGQHVVLEHGGEAKVVNSEPLAAPAAATLAAAPAQPPAALVRPVVAQAARTAQGAQPARTAQAAPARKTKAAATPPKAVSSKPAAKNATLAANRPSSPAGAGGTAPRASMPPEIATVRGGPANW